MIEVGKFVVVITAEFEQHGLNEGDVVYVAGDLIVPTNKEDPYNLRRIFLGSFVDDSGHILVNKGCFTIDGLKLRLLPDDEQDRLNAIRIADFPVNPAAPDEAAN